MIPQTPYALRADKQLEPDRMNQALRRLMQFQRAEAEKRWSFETITIPLAPDIDQTTAAGSKTMTIELPREYTLIGRELYVYGDDGVVFTLSITAGATLEDVDATGAGSGTLGVGRSQESALVSAGASLTFTVDCADATYTLDKCWVVLQIAYDRHEGTLPTVDFEDNELQGSDTPTMAQAKQVLNDALANGTNDLASMNTSLSNNQRRLRCTVIPFEFGHTSTIATGESDVPLPADLGYIHSFELWACADGSVGSLSAELFDEGATSKGTATVTPTGAANMVQSATTPSVAERQGSSDPGTAGSDWYVTFGRANPTGTIYAAYAVIYWTG